jgi:hypothetical protein
MKDEYNKCALYPALIWPSSQCRSILTTLSILAVQRPACNPVQYDHVRHTNLGIDARRLFPCLAF